MFCCGHGRWDIIDVFGLKTFRERNCFQHESSRKHQERAVQVSQKENFVFENWPGVKSGTTASLNYFVSLGTLGGFEQMKTFFS